VTNVNELLCYILTSSKIFSSLFLVFSSIINRDLGAYKASAGGATVILYGKNEKGELIGKFAGVASYNMSSNALFLSVKGINPDNKECYGETYYEDVRW